MDILTDRLESMAGVSFGHWTDEQARTGCTVIRFDRPALTAVDVRGAAPGSRELDLLHPGRTVQRPDALLLTGGSAFGLAAADGVMRWMHEHGRGFATSAIPVPIVPAAVIFDLAVGEAVWPDAEAGYSATETAGSLEHMQTGQVGAGTGATSGSIGGPDASGPGGCVAAQVRIDEGVVTAIAIVNPFGSLSANLESDSRVSALSNTRRVQFGENTTLLTCVTDLALDHDALMGMTVGMHDGLARAVVPVHTAVDGDLAFASTTNEVAACDANQAMRSRLAAELAIEAAIATLGTRTRWPHSL